jgi:rhamnulokinase
MNSITKKILAIDIGASGGNHMLGIDQHGQIELEEIYHFDNAMTEDPSYGLVWDIKRLWHEVYTGIKQAIEKHPDIHSIGIDMWGVDYVLLNDDDLIEPVYAYRNSRTQMSIPRVHELISHQELYEITGIQYQPFNTIYQLYQDKMTGRLKKANSFLMLPEYFIWKLTGEKIHEYTNATTTSLVDIKTKEYSKKIIDKLGLSSDFFTHIVHPGVELELKECFKKEFNTNAKVILTATHDTASAVEAVEIQDHEAFISSGTWSLIGIKTQKDFIHSKALELNYTHEGGPGYIRLQKNIMGLWIVQQLKKECNFESYEEIVKSAKTSSFIDTFDVNANRFLSPKHMKQEIIQSFIDCNQYPPRSNSDVLNSVFHSLALSYKHAIREIEDITDQKIHALHIFGGGARNEHLNDLIRQQIEIPVYTYPIEASSLGNIKIQGGSKHE